MPRFTREGRVIHLDGKPFVYVSREGDTPPVVADEVARAVLRALNAGKLRGVETRKYLRKTRS